MGGVSSPVFSRSHRAGHPLSPLGALYTVSCDSRVHGQDTKRGAPLFTPGARCYSGSAAGVRCSSVFTGEARCSPGALPVSTNGARRPLFTECGVLCSLLELGATRDRPPEFGAPPCSLVKPGAPLVLSLCSPLELCALPEFSTARRLPELPAGGRVRVCVNEAAAALLTHTAAAGRG